MSKQREPKNRNIGLAAVVLMAVGLLLLSGFSDNKTPDNIPASLSSPVIRTSPDNASPSPSGKTHAGALQ